MSEDTLFELPGAVPTDDTAARDDLRKQLPALRGGGCPEGSDEAILEMSCPPAYTACPNPYVKDWLASLPPRSDAGRRDPGPFTEDVSAGKVSPIYKAHSYPTKVPPEIILRQILHYTQPGDVVLDGFAGTGMTGVAVQMAGKPDPKVRKAIEAEAKGSGRDVQWGTRYAVLNDLSPSATFIAAGLNLAIDAAAFDVASKQLLDWFDDEYGWMYQTTVHGKSARIDYTIWSEVRTCPHCGGAVVLYDVAFDPDSGRVAEDFDCAHCGASLTKRRTAQRLETVRTLAGDTITRPEYRPVRVIWSRSGGGRRTGGEKHLDETDHEVLRRVAALSLPGIPHWVFPYRHMTHERTTIAKSGYSSVHHLYPDRALAALAILWERINDDPDPGTRQALKFWVEQAFWGLSWMNRYRPKGFSQVSQYQSGVFYIPALVSECSVRYNLEGSDPTRGKRASLAKLWKSWQPRKGTTMITTGSADSLPIPDSSIDYIFVDPPFGENIYYADLAQVTEAWHGVLTCAEKEAIEDRNRRAPKTLEAYGDLMTECFREFHRVLKPDRWMTVEFSNHSNEVWGVIQQAISTAGFVVADTRVLDKGQGSYRQVTATNAVKRDLVLSCYKPNTELTATVLKATADRDTVWTFVKEHLRHLPVTDAHGNMARDVRERHADRLYDRMVAFHVANRRPVPMAVAEFYAGLDAHFSFRDGMYFLPDQAAEYDQFRIRFRDLVAADALYVSDESSAIAWLRQLIKSRKRTMSFAEIQPEYMKELQRAAEGWNELPDLKALLEENFIQTGGRWDVPDPKKAEHLEQLRQAELLKVYSSYVSSRGKLSRFRGEAVLAGFKRAWEAGNYREIVDVGSRLPDDALVDLPALVHYIRNAQKRLGG